MMVDWTIKYSHKIFDDINIKSLLKDSVISKHIPVPLKKKFKIRKIFAFSENIGKKIFNYNEVFKSAGTMSFTDISNMSCECATSSLCHGHFHHVITGDLNIIQEPGLRQLCSYGTKFRDIPRLDLSSIMNQFKNDVNELTKMISKKFKTSISVFKPWKKSLVNRFEQRLNHYAMNKRYDKPFLSSMACKNELKRLKERFVITVLDKASGNFAFTCKKFYFLKLAEELGLNNVNPGNDTYRFCPDSEQTICDRIIADIAKFKIAPPDNQRKLALLYQTPKFHKNPPKMRYIAGNVNCVTSQLDDKIARVLKMCKSHFRNLCGVYERYSGVKHCFDVETSTEVKDIFDNAHGKVDSISINDFSTLYTLFDHDHLLSNMRWLFETLSKNSGYNCIKIEYKSARWVQSANGDNTYTVGEILDMITFLIKQTYIKAFGHIFQQVKGMIMGGKVSGWLSDCSLMVDEFKYVRNKISNGLLIEADRKSVV